MGSIALTHPEAQEVIKIAFAVDERPHGKGPIEYNKRRGLLVQLASWVETKYGRLKFPSPDGTQPQNNVIAHQCYRNDPDSLCWWGEDGHGDGTRFRVRFRARPTLLMGFRDAVTFCDHAGLWAITENPSLEAWVKDMRARNFFGAPVERYLLAMRRALAEVRKGLGVAPEGNASTREPVRPDVMRAALGLDEGNSMVGGWFGSGDLTETDRKQANIQRLKRAAENMHDDLLRHSPQITREAILSIEPRNADVKVLEHKIPKLGPSISKELPGAVVSAWLRWRRDLLEFADRWQIELVGTSIDASIEQYDKELREWHKRLSEAGVKLSEPPPAPPRGPDPDKPSSWSWALPVALLGVLGIGAIVLMQQKSPPTQTPEALR